MSRQIVVKVGTSTLIDTDGRLDRIYINRLALQIAELRHSGNAVLLVTSGAIRAGMERLGMSSRPVAMPLKQAAASVGQSALMNLYADIFANYAVPVGQLLLTRDDIQTPERRDNARNTFDALFSLGALPIVNENDTVAVEEIRVGDNDTLAAHVAVLVDADALILLSDVDGLYDKDPLKNPDAEIIRHIEQLDASVWAMADNPNGEAQSEMGTGGMYAKLCAARIALDSHIPMWIANGRCPNVLRDCVNGSQLVGTRFGNTEGIRKANGANTAEQ